MQLQAAANRIKRIFRDNLYKREVESKRGKLNFSALYKHKVSNKVFKKPQTNWGKQYNIEILLDTSGSMQSDNRFYKSMQVCARLCELLWPVANVWVATFNYIEERMSWKEMIIKAQEPRSKLEDEYMDETRYKTLNINGSAYIVKNTDDNPYYIDYDAWECLDHWFPASRAWTLWSRACSGNREICNIVNAAERLKNFEWHKFIIVILDWLPNLDHHYGSRNKDMNTHIAWQSILRYTKDNYREKIMSLERQWYNVLAIWLWSWADGIKTYFPKNFLLYKPDDVYGIIVEYFEKFTHDH